MKNVGTAALTFKGKGYTIIGTGHDDLNNSPFPTVVLSLKSGEQREIEVPVTPSSFDEGIGTLTIETDDPDEPKITIELRWFGTASVLSLTSQQKAVKRTTHYA